MYNKESIKLLKGQSIHKFVERKLKISFYFPLVINFETEIS